MHKSKKNLRAEHVSTYGLAPMGGVSTYGEGVSTYGGVSIGLVRNDRRVCGLWTFGRWSSRMRAVLG